MDDLTFLDAKNQDLEEEIPFDSDMSMIHNPCDFSMISEVPSPMVRQQSQTWAELGVKPTQDLKSNDIDQT